MERRRRGSSQAGPAQVGPAGEDGHPGTGPEQPARHATLRSPDLDRRSLLRWSAGMAALLALPTVPYAARIAEAVTTTPRLPLLWLNGQDCTGDIESFLRSTRAAPTDLFLNQVSLDYSELIMAGSGAAAEGSLADTVARYAGRYVLVVEGSVPTAQNGIFCTVGGRSFTSVLQEAAAGALAVIAVGTCAVHGGLPLAAGGDTGAAGVRSVLGTGGPPVIALPGCPVNGEVLTATLVNYLTLGTWPALDSKGRPTFAYGRTVHSRCERRTFFQAGKFVLAWGDAGHQAGWCLKQMGCRGQTTYNNCPVEKWNGATSWPVGSGAPCIGCSEAGFWD